LGTVLKERAPVLETWSGQVARLMLASSAAMMK